MVKALQDRLDPVRRRQRWVHSLRWAAWGLVASAAVAALFALGRWLGGWELTVPRTLAIVLSGPIVGALAALIARSDWRAAARAIDAHYRMQDRTTSALEFLSREDVTSVHQLAVDDAIEHLNKVDAREVVPIQVPRALPYGVAAMIAAALLLFVTSRPAEVSASPPQALPVVLTQAERLADELKSLEEFAKENKDPEIEKLVEEMKAAIEELKRPEVDLREALAKLSEMEAALQQQQSQYNVEVTDAQLAAVGEVLALATPLANAGKALAAGQFDKAAQELKEAEAPELDRQTEKSMKEKLEAVAKQMQDQGASALSKATGEMSAGLGGDGRRFKEGAEKLGGEASKHSKRKKLHDLLHKQCQCLGECKGECESESKNDNAKKSNKSSNSWGLGRSGNEAGDATPNLGGKQEMRLSGKQSDEGEVETETMHSPEGKEEARRAYRESYDKFRKISEAVLETEPIPLGHRQTIRRYFESIRPSENDPAESGEPASAPAGSKPAEAAVPAEAPTP